MNQTTQQILEIFQGYRMTPTPIDEYEQKGKAILGDKLESFINNNQPIKHVMLGFPFKSTNIRDKVIGVMPDLGEELTMKNFQRFNEDVKKVYTPGISITIASDGYLFNDILSVDDKIVHEYGEIAKDMAKNTPVEIISLDDVFSGENLLSKRDKVMTQFGVSAEKLEQEIILNPDVNILYKGMIRFMDEELADKPFESGNQRHKAAKRLVKEMMARNEAWSNLVSNDFKNYIRLSMHPSVNNGKKYSFQLIPGHDNRYSPWHCAIWLRDDEAVTIHRKDAELKGLQLVYKDNRPYYFTN